MTEAAVWLTLLLIFVVANSIAVWRGGSGRYRPPPFLLAMAAVLVQLAASALIVLAAWWSGQRFSQPSYVPVLSATLGVVVVWFMLVMGVLRFTFTETFRAGIAAGLTSACVLGFAVIPLLVIYRTYEIPTNSMAPTLRGRHFVGHCPSCGGLTVVSFREADGTIQPEETGICSHCLQVRPAEHVAEQVKAGERIFVRRLATPRRWDVVVLYPGDQSQIYMMRLVGLPGESVAIKEGGVWINGVRQEPPPELAGLRWYVADDTSLDAQFATDGDPTQLTDKQYFVLGDFSPNSYDSRFCGPVPTDDLRGVVSAVYWPPESARLLPRH